jgi:hypothetical protein
MKPVFRAILVLLNCILAGALFVRSDRQVSPGRVETVVTPTSNKTVAVQAKPKPKVVPETPFAAIYSRDPKQFAANLRAIGCPEETVKDILIAEVNRGYAAEEKTLRPTPADHVPFGWSAKTTEGKILERRQRSAAVAREKQATLRNALGYEVPVKMPNYAMTRSDEAFEDFLKTLPPEKRVIAQQAQENYWAQVQGLRAETRGFWLPEEVERVNQLQETRKMELAKLGGGQ